VFCRVAQFYGHTFAQVLEMPVRIFWVLERQISRIQADSDLRHLALLAASHGGENFQTTHARLVAELGTVAAKTTAGIMNVKLDEAGLQELQGMGNIR
jgi:hypothetical protein